jgi:hypothetical protein
MKKTLFAALLLLISMTVFAQTTPYIKDGKLNFNEDGSHYIKATFVSQIWARFNESNPGTVLYGFGKPNTFDIGLRRTRLQLFGQLTDKVFFYTQFGMNNFNNLSDRQVGAFFHDVIAEYKVGNALSLGGGLGGWNGLSRFSSPSIGSIMCLDAPLFAQATNGSSDQFLRKLSIYAKGKIGKLDYRIMLTDPMVIQKAAMGTGLQEPLQNRSTFSLRPPKAQYQGYFSYQFLDQESNLLPYAVGTYLGKKKVFNIGGGFVYQPNAMWHKDGTDTVQTPLFLLALDVFYDAPLNTEKGTAISFYGGYFNYDFGPGYIRSNNAMNPAAGGTIKAGFTTFGGAGNVFPMIGTGNILYGQLGYLLAKDLFGNNGTLQPYASVMYAKFNALEDAGTLLDLGVNWLINGHNAKLSLDYQCRPVFATTVGSNPVNTGQKGALILQYQIS